MTQREALLPVLRAALAKAPGVRVAILFGSVARGDDTAESDVDVAVSGDVDPIALSAELAAALGREVDVVGADDATIPLLDQIVKDGIVVHERRPGLGASWWWRALLVLETDRPWFAGARDAWLRHVARSGV